MNNIPWEYWEISKMLLNQIDGFFKLINFFSHLTILNIYYIIEIFQHAE